MTDSRRLRLPIVLLVVGLLAVATACAPPSGSACGLVDYANTIQTDVDTLSGLDAAQVATAGTPDNLTALATLDTLDATVAEAQTALDAASDDDVGGAVRASFQGVLDATSSASSSLRSAIAAGDEGEVSLALTGLSAVSVAISAFTGLVNGVIGEGCPGASASASASAAATIEPTPTLEPDPRPHGDTRPAHRDTGTDRHARAYGHATGIRDRDARGSYANCRSDGHAGADSTPRQPRHPARSDRNRSSPTIEPSPTASEPPSPDDEGSGLLPWILVLGAGGLGAAAIVLWYMNRDEEGEPPDDLGTPPDDLGGPEAVPGPEGAVGPDDATSVTPTLDVPPPTAPPPATTPPSASPPQSPPTPPTGPQS